MKIYTGNYPDGVTVHLTSPMGKNYREIRIARYADGSFLIWAHGGSLFNQEAQNRDAEKALAPLLKKLDALTWHAAVTA